MLKRLELQLIAGSYSTDGEQSEKGVESPIGSDNASAAAFQIVRLCQGVSASTLYRSHVSSYVPNFHLMHVGFHLMCLPDTKGKAL
jgi:hypothetical protein